MFWNLAHVISWRSSGLLQLANCIECIYSQSQTSQKDKNMADFFQANEHLMANANSIVMNQREINK